MKNSNVVLSIEEGVKKVLKLDPDGCRLLYRDEHGTTRSDPDLTRDEAVKAAKAILDYYDEY